MRSIFVTASTSVAQGDVSLINLARGELLQDDDGGRNVSESWGEKFWSLFRGTYFQSQADNLTDFDNLEGLTSVITHFLLFNKMSTSAGIVSDTTSACQWQKAALSSCACDFDSCRCSKGLLQLRQTRRRCQLRRSTGRIPKHLVSMNLQRTTTCKYGARPEVVCLVVLRRFLFLIAAGIRSATADTLICTLTEMIALRQQCDFCFFVY